MKIKEIINTPKKSFDTTNSGTIYSIESEPQAQDIVPQNNTPERIVAEMVDDQILEMPDHSAIRSSPLRSERRDSRRPDWQVRNLPKPNGRGQEQEDWQESRSRKEDKKARALHLK